MSTTKSQQKGGKRERVNELKPAFAYNLFYNQGKAPENATLNDFYMAVALTVRDRMQHLFIKLKGYCQLFCVNLSHANFLKKGRFLGTFPIGFDLQCSSILTEIKARSR